MLFSKQQNMAIDLIRKGKSPVVKGKIGRKTVRSLEVMGVIERTTDNKYKIISIDGYIPGAYDSDADNCDHVTPYGYWGPSTD